MRNIFAAGPLDGFNATMRPYDRSNPPPVTITGVAPWAKLGGNVAAAPGADSNGARSTSLGISTTSMPGGGLRPFNPKSGGGRSGAPPNSLTSTIQEAKLARAAAEAKVELAGSEFFMLLVKNNF